MEWGFFSLSPGQSTAVRRMSRAMEDMHSALYTGHLRAFVFPYPLYVAPNAVYWVQFNWVGDAVELFTLDLSSLTVMVRTVEPYVFSSLDEDQKEKVVRGTNVPDELCDTISVTVSDVESYVSENLDYWEDRALSLPGLAD